MQSFPWDNTSPTQLDRNTKSQILAEVFFYALCGFKSGIFMNFENNAEVTAGAVTNTVILSHSMGAIRGRIFDTERSLEIEMTASEGDLDRYDSIIFRRDNTNREVTYATLVGEPALYPVPPTLTRNADVEEVRVCNIMRRALSIDITDSDIFPTLGNADDIELIPTVNDIDVTYLLSQMQAQFETWFEDINAKLGDEPATALQEQIDDMKDATVDGSLQKQIDSLGTDKAPNDHSSADTTYGAGNQTEYGHLMLSDSENSTAGINNGKAATPYSVKKVNDKIINALDEDIEGSLANKIADLDLGKAPSGYGLGGYAKKITSMSEAIVTGFYFGENVIGSPFGNAYIFIEVIAASDLTRKIVVTDFNNFSNVRVGGYLNGVEKPWINPYA